VSRAIRWAAVAFVASLVVLRSARADEVGREVTAHFAWRAPPGCVNDRTLVESVEKLLKRRVFVAADQADVQIEGAAEPRAEGGWSAKIEMRARDGRSLGVRSIVSDGSDCRRVEGPLAVVLALLVDFERREIELEIPAPPAEPTPLPPPAESKAISPSEREHAAPAPPADVVRGATAFGAAAAWGMVPGLAFGLVARGELETVERWAVALELGVWPGHRHADAGRGGEFSAWTGSVLACPDLVSAGRFRGRACGGITAGSISGTGMGLVEVESPNRLYFDAGARAGVTLRVFGPFALAAELGAAVPLARPRFFYERADGSEVTVYRVAAIVPLAAVFVRTELAN
jgi:hypothetical protein